MSPTRSSAPTNPQLPVSQRPIPGLLTLLLPSYSTFSSTSSVRPLDRSVNDRLHHLRLENKRHQANLLRAQPLGPASVPIITRPAAYIASASLGPGLNVFPYRISDQSEQVSLSRHAGPPPPASWLSAPVFCPDVNPSSPIFLPPSGVQCLPLALRFRQALLHRASSTSPQKLQLSSLFDTCLRCLAFDLSYRGTGSAFQIVGQLDELHKQRLLEIASEWAPLDDCSLLALFPPSQSDSPVKDNDDTQDSWEADLDPVLSFAMLDLSFSSVTLPALRRLLFTDGNLRAPWLTTLRLDHALCMPLSTALFTLLTALPLTHLSFAAGALDPTLSPALALPRLASSTPSLEFLDLSYNPHWAGLAGLGTVDWHLKWHNLHRLVLVGNFPRSCSAATSVAIRTDSNQNLRTRKIDEMLRTLFKTRLERGGQWVECSL